MLILCRYVKRLFTRISYRNVSSARKPMPDQGWYGCVAPTVSPTVDAAARKSGRLEGHREGGAVVWTLCHR